MPKILRQNLPPALYAHLLERVQQKRISGQQLTLLVRWMDTHPEVPNGRWFKGFPEMWCVAKASWSKRFSCGDKFPPAKKLFRCGVGIIFVEFFPGEPKLRSPCGPN